MKTCSRCGEAKPVDAFYRRSRAADGLQPYCKVCASAAAKQHYAEHGDIVRANNRAWYRANREHSKATAAVWCAAHPELVRANSRRWAAANSVQVAAAVRQYRAAHPERYAAHRAVRAAVRTGVLLREPCLFCGAVRVDAHHHDYTQPLAVTWLCRKHHKLAHRGDTT